MRRQLNFEALSVFDHGRVKAVSDKLITAAIKDCEDRPSVSKARTVKIEISFVPVVSQNAGLLESVKVGVDVRGSAPAYGTVDYACDVQDGNQLVFQDFDDRNPNQTAIDDHTESEDEAA